MLRRFLLTAGTVVLITSGCSSGYVDGTQSSDASSSTTSVAAVTTTIAAPSTPEAPDDGFPVTIAAPNGRVTIESRPERIVSIAPTSTEVLFAVGAGDQVVAVDGLSNYPGGAPVTDLSAFTPSVEAIAEYNPDLVFISFDPGEVIPGLEAIGIPVILHPTASSMDDAYAQWHQVGAATGHRDEAEAVVDEVSESITSAVEVLPVTAEPLTYYYELDPSFYSATSTTFIGGLLALSGMDNIADAADDEGYGYPQLNAEYIIEADPSLILLADTKCCGQTVESVSGRPGWSTMSAVINGSVVQLDDDIASRWGPRIAYLVEDVVAAILELELSEE